MPEKTARKTGGRRRDRDAVDRSAVRARSFWSGTITFGLVSIPVDLLPAQRPSGPSMTMLGPEGRPLSRRYFEPESGREVRGDEVLRGYEVEPGRFVLVEDEELEALAPEKTRVIDLEVFVPAAAVDPVFFQRGYFLTPSGESNKPYRLLAEALERTDRAGIATFVMRGKEYLVAILSEGGILRAEVLRFADEIRTAEDVGLPEPDAPEPKRVKEMEKEIGKLARAGLDPDELRDEEAERIERLAEKRLRSGEGVARAEEEAGPAEEVPDLMNVLRWSLRHEGGEGGGRRGRGGKAGGKDGGKAARKERRPAGADLGELTKDELYARAQEREIPGRSGMTKGELVEALRESA